MKFQRQAKILDLIDQFEIETQEELSEHLRDLGYTTTQATVSRDIKELRLIKILSSTTGKYRYAVATSEIIYAQNMVVIKTLPGLGQAAAMAIDAMRDKRVVGTLGGDDTVFIVMRDESVASQFCIEAQKTLL